MDTNIMPTVYQYLFQSNFFFFLIMFFTDQMGNGTSLLVTTETTEYDLSQLHHIVLCGPTQLQGYLAIVWLIKLQQLQ